MIAQNILVATDFSVLSRGVVEHALQLADVLDAQLTVVSAHAPLGAHVERELRAEMTELERALKPSGRLARTILHPGEPADTILLVARQLGADMIVMGTNNRHGFSRLVTGSTAQKVLQRAEIPVLVVTKTALHAQGAHAPAVP